MDGNDELLGIENLIGSRFDDVLTGGAGANAIWGGTGDDIVAGSAGSDILNGEAGVEAASFAGSVSGGERQPERRSGRG